MPQIKRKIKPPVQPAPAPTDGKSAWLASLGKPAPAAPSPAKRPTLKAPGKKPAVTAPPAPAASVTTPRKRRKNMGEEGHTILTLGEPIKTRDLKVGMRVHYSGAICLVFRYTKSPFPESAHLRVIELREHPTRGEFTTVANLDDVWYQKITGKRNGDV